MSAQINILIQTETEEPPMMFEDVKTTTVFVDDDPEYVLTDKAYIKVENKETHSFISIKFEDQFWIGTFEQLAESLNLKQ